MFNQSLALAFFAALIALVPLTASAQDRSGSTESKRKILLPKSDAHYRPVAGYVEDIPDTDYRHASVAAYESFRDMKFGVRIHWGLYSIWNLQNESWPFLKMSNEDRQRYQNLYRQWNPSAFDAEKWMTIFQRAGARFFTFTTRHHEGFAMFDTATRIHERVNWNAPGGPRLEPCDLPYSIMETPFHRDVVGELTSAAHRHGLKIDLYYSLPDWYDADFRPYSAHPLQITDSATWAPYDFQLTGTLFEKSHPPTLLPDPTPLAESRMMARLHDQLVELATKYGKIDMIGLDMWLGPRAWPRLKETVKELRHIQPDVMLRARGIGNYGDYFTPENFVPGDKQNTEMPWFVIYPLARSFSYDPNAADYKGAGWIIHTLVDTVAKGGNLEIGIGPDAEGRFHPAAVAQMEEAGEWLKANGEAIYGTRPRTGNRWKDGKNIRYTKAKLADTLYAICLSWPTDHQVILHNVRAEPASQIYLLGQPGSLPWRADGDDTIIDLEKAPQPPAGPAYVFKLHGR